MLPAILANYRRWSLAVHSTAVWVARHISTEYLTQVPVMYCTSIRTEKQGSVTVHGIFRNSVTDPCFSVYEQK